MDGGEAGEARASKTMVLKLRCLDIVFSTTGLCRRDLSMDLVWSPWLPPVGSKAPVKLLYTHSPDLGFLLCEMGLFDTVVSHVVRSSME